MASSFLLNGLNFDASREDPTGVRTLLSSTATSFSFTNSEGSATTLAGTGFRYGSDVSEGPVAGTITSVSVTADGSSSVAFQVNGPIAVSALPDDFLTDDDAFYGALLGGDDSLDLRAGNTISNLFAPTVIAGDGLLISETATTGADSFTIGAAAGQFIGDTVFVDADTVVTGGDDVMVAASAADLVGDFNTVRGGAVARGGDDRLTTGEEGVVNGDVIDMLFGGVLIGGRDVIVAGGGATVNGDARRLDDFSNALTFVGGNDTITIRGNEGATVRGDIARMLVERSTGDANQIRFGSDRFNGGDGGDTIYGDAEFISTSIIVTLGNDVIIANGGDDTILGDVGRIASGTSPLLFRGGNDVIFAGAGDDIVLGQIGNDRLYGQQGDDLLRGEEGDDQLFGVFGNDTLEGGLGDDRLFGQVGNDVLEGGAGSDLLDGGAGQDIASYENENAAVKVDLLRPATNTGAAANDTLTSIEGVRGTGFADTLVGANTNDVLEGGAGDDLMGGRNGSDILRGGDGADRLFGSNGFDVLDGGAGADILVGGAQNDAASYESSEEGVLADLLARGRNTGDAAGDVYSSIENLIGSNQNDQLLGDNARNVLSGSDGNDLLVGRGGNDVIVGGDGIDQIGGGAGNDVIRGGVEGDRLFGGAGRDRFVYDDGETFNVTLETIVDFRRGQDVVDLSAIDANENVAGDQAFRFVTELSGAAGEIAFVQRSGNVGVLAMETNGDGTVDEAIAFENVFFIGPRDLIL